MIPSTPNDFAPADHLLPPYSKSNDSAIKASINNAKEESNEPLPALVDLEKEELIHSYGAYIDCSDLEAQLNAPLYDKDADLSLLDNEVDGLTADAARLEFFQKVILGFAALVLVNIGAWILKGSSLWVLIDTLVILICIFSVIVLAFNFGQYEDPTKAAEQTHDK